MSNGTSDGAGDERADRPEPRRIDDGEGEIGVLAGGRKLDDHRHVLRGADALPLLYLPPRRVELSDAPPGDRLPGSRYPGEFFHGCAGPGGPVCADYPE